MTAAGADGAGRQDRAAAMAAWWVRCYTSGVAAEAAEGRRAEIASDVFEQRVHGSSIDAPPFAVTSSIVWRVVGGMPADLIWSRQQRVVSRGRPSEREVHVMSRTTRMARHGWWRLVAAAIVAFYAYAIIGNLADDEGPYLSGTIACAVGAVAVVAGLGLHGSRRPVADVLLVVGLVPALLVIWLWPVAVTALVVIVFALVDLADVRAVHRAGHASV
jgi:hypothetical protein